MAKNDSIVLVLVPEIMTESFQIQWKIPERCDLSPYLKDLLEKQPKEQNPFLGGEEQKEVGRYKGA